MRLIDIITTPNFRDPYRYLPTENNVAQVKVAENVKSILLTATVIGSFGLVGWLVRRNEEEP